MVEVLEEEVVVVVVRTMSPMARVDRQTGAPPCQAGITSGVIVSGQLEPGVRQARVVELLGLSGTATTSHFSFFVVSCCFLMWAVRLSFLGATQY